VLLSGVLTSWLERKMDWCCSIDRDRERYFELTIFFTRIILINFWLGFVGLSTDIKTKIPTDGSTGGTKYSCNDLRQKESCSCLLLVMVEKQNPQNWWIVWCEFYSIFLLATLGFQILSHLFYLGFKSGASNPSRSLSRFFSIIWIIFCLLKQKWSKHRFCYEFLINFGPLKNVSGPQVGRPCFKHC
jgi:hypothetical protein